MENEMKNEVQVPSEKHGERECMERKDGVKEKVLLFIIGVLAGAVISTGAFFAYIKLAGLGTTSGQAAMMQGGQMNGQGGTPPDMPSGGMNGQQPPEMPSGDNSGSGQGGTPPDMTSGGNSGNSQSGTPPDMPGNNNTQNSSN